ncbi:Afadin and alpha-actinin-binding-domain-containing protein [Paraphoma chrysanthemicola]|uniref:Afadin and alpha-actinin-binding-domain-containing protein n=1 Tax=Paraphoma chrysanthemicola TaxID=798071 RepID=A0A8K0R401_9PLEO|nr:Afadin and alpha-actinin-binding-domain-containing protein [Paraphoma chrysanthemicola]
MEAHNLKTASAYINNLLLARGLLRDGKAIEFAHPSRGQGGKEQTMAHIINLVHDLILKRDRDQEYRESIAETLRTLRSESTRQTSALEKLQTRNDDLARQMSLAQSQERSARAALRTAESSARSLREEMLRLKTTVQQVRTSCANDVRKRDVQIQRLKSHLTTQQRGNKTGLVGASITINPGTIGLGGSTSSIRDDVPDLEDPGYSLKQETTEFLTQLSQSLSDENDNLIGLVRSTLVTLKELQGMPEQTSREDGEGLSVIGEEDESTHHGMLNALPTNYETLANDMETVLDNLKNLLTNPNFVAVDEVEMREEEIHRLRAGWEKMEARLREAFMLMDSWRKRMTNGDTINLEELKMGLGLGAGLDTVNREDDSTVEDDDEEDVEGEESSVFDEELDEVEQEPELPSPEKQVVPDPPTNSDIFGLKLQPKSTALRETNGNKSPIRSPRKVAFSASIPNTPTQLEDENADASGLDLVGAEKMSPTLASRIGSEERVSRSTPQDDRTLRRVSYDRIANRIVNPASNFSFSTSHIIPSTSYKHSSSNAHHQTRKRHSSPHAHPDEPSPKLTVHDKLAQAEADAVAIAQGLRVASATTTTDEVEAQQEKSVKKRAMRSPTKTKIQGRPKRRKSTLTPEELENLLGC